jgi:hypothetical protein
LTNLQEYKKGTDPHNPDTDGDGLKDGVETGTGIFVSKSDTGTDPLNPDTDGDGLLDGVETGTGIYKSPTDTGTDPNKPDSDGDGFPDGLEIEFGSNPDDPNSVPAKPGFLNLLAWWNFNDASNPTNALDSLHSYIGIVTNGAVFTADAAGHTGKAGDRAMDMGSDSNGEGVIVTNADFLSIAGVLDTITVSYWEQLAQIAPGGSSAFWADAKSTARALNAHVPWSDDTIYFDTDGCCAASQRISQNINTFTNEWTDDTFWNSWHHFAFVKNGPTKQIWIDGQLFLQGVGASPLPTDMNVLSIGRVPDADGGGGTIEGQIDDFAVYAAALDAKRIGELASGTAPDKLSTEAIPTLEVSFDGTHWTLTWTGTLQVAPAPSGPWTDAPTTYVSPLTGAVSDLPGKQGFYRTRQ